MEDQSSNPGPWVAKWYLIDGTPSQIGYHENEPPTLPEDATEISAPPTGAEVWMDGAWVLPPAPFRDLNPALFLTMLGLLGITVAQIHAAIDAAISDPVAAAYAKNKVTTSTSYSRANPLFALLGPAMNKTPSQIDAAWRQAETIADATGF